MMILVTGANGQLGAEVSRQLRAARIPCVCADRDMLDVLDQAAVVGFFEQYRPDAVIHCAADNDVDEAERRPEKCCLTNGLGTQNIVRGCLRVGAKLLLVSTAYVFPGDTEGAIDTDAPRRAVNLYGQSKLQAELAVQEQMDRWFIVRTSWLFGLCDRHVNRVTHYLKDAQGHRELPVEEDLIASPTYTVDLAAFLIRLVQTSRYGVYHAANQGWCSAAELARETLRLYGSRCQVRPVPSDHSRVHAARPRNSVLSCASMPANGFELLPPWQDALGRYIRQLKKSESLRKAGESE